MGIEKVKEIKVENGQKLVPFKSQPIVPRVSLDAPKDSVNFTGISAAEKEVMNLTKQKKAILWMKKQEWLKGEIGGILLTALGTGLVAPVFIGFNPFVKAPKDATQEQKREIVNTKLYTAMRQPISAALAILFQASVQKYIDRGLDAVFNNSERMAQFSEKLDQSYLNTESYVKAKVKEDLKARGIKKPSFWASLFSKKKKRDGEKVSLRSQYDMIVNDRVELIRDRQLDDIAKAFERDNKIYVNSAKDADGKIILGTRHLNNETVAELVNKQVVEYQKDAAKLTKTAKQIDEYLDKAETFINNEDKLRKMFADNPWNEIKATSDPAKIKELNEKTTKMLKDLLDSEPNNSKIKGLLEEILSYSEDLRAYKVQRTLDRIDYIKRMCPKGFTRDRYRSALIERNNVLQERNIKLEGCKIKDVAKATEESIARAINNIAKVCSFKDEGALAEAVLKDTDTFSSDIKALKSKIYKDVAKGYKELVKNRYKGWNQAAKVFVGVFITLPITCTALNWVYPRFMELFFPKLAGVKKAQDQKQAQKIGGDK